MFYSTKGYETRDAEEQQWLAFEYLDAEEDERGDIFDEFGVRYTEFAWLRYFDIVRMTIIDPMHCILLSKTYHLYGYI